MVPISVRQTSLCTPRRSVPNATHWTRHVQTKWRALMSDASVNRRAFLAGACSFAALGLTALPVAADTAVTKLPDGKLAVRLRKVPALSAVGGAVRIGSLKGVPVGLARTGPKTYKAFSLRCPHQGAIVTRDASGWVCPAHGSEFEPDGDLVLGPATTGLARVPARMVRGEVIIG